MKLLNCSGFDPTWRWVYHRFLLFMFSLGRNYFLELTWVLVVETICLPAFEPGLGTFKAFFFLAFGAIIFHLLFNRLQYDCSFCWSNGFVSNLFCNLSGHTSSMYSCSIVVFAFLSLSLLINIDYELSVALLTKWYLIVIHKMFPKSKENEDIAKPPIADEKQNMIFRLKQK